MGFSDQIKQFVDGAKAKLDGQVKVIEENAKKRLHEILGDDVSLIKSIRLDADVGKFHSIDAPPSVIDRLRTAGLLKD